MIISEIISSIYTVSKLIYGKVQLVKENAKECKELCEQIKIVNDYVERLEKANKAQEHEAALLKLNGCIKKCQDFIMESTKDKNIVKRMLKADDAKEEFNKLMKELHEIVEIFTLALTISQVVDQAKQNAEDKEQSERMMAKLNALYSKLNLVIASTSTNSSSASQSTLSGHSSAPLQLSSQASNYAPVCVDYKPVPKQGGEVVIVGSYAPTGIDYSAAPKSGGSNLAVAGQGAMVFSFPNFDSTIDTLKKKADNGDIKALNDLGERYYAQGTDQGYAMAFGYFSQAANKGDITAKFNLGTCYYNGHGVAQDFKIAVDWFSQAGNAGELEAQNMLGNIYKKGKGSIAQDLTVAFGFFLRAAEKGHKAAQFNVGACYQTGQGTKQNNEKALKWYMLAAEQNHSDAQYFTGLLHEKGWGTTQSYPMAAHFYGLAKQQKQSQAEQRLEKLTREGHIKSSLSSVAIK